MTASTKVLDLGCGEGKNAAPFALNGCEVDAVYCSSAAISNGKRAFSDAPVRWLLQDALNFNAGRERYDVVICYGLFHCLKSVAEVERLLNRVQLSTKRGGLNAVCTFNDRSHDFSAHPGFEPTLLPHSWYLIRYAGWRMEQVSDSDLHETHPHNNIPHHHSMTRILAMKL